jgi:multidrug transporter EmrE-like cation transporter
MLAVYGTRSRGPLGQRKTGPIMNWTLIVFSVSLSAIAQIILKAGMSSSATTEAMKSGAPLGIASAVATNPWVIGGLGLYFLGALVWLFVLARVEVSFAYPFVGLGFIFTLILGAFLMGDNITVPRLAGTLLVAAGVVMISRS